MHFFKSAVICAALVTMCGCDRASPESASAIGMEFKLIPAGSFTMGEGDDAHEVTLTTPFKMGVHEVAQAQYEQVMGFNPSHFKGGNHPVETVTWVRAVEFCRRLSDLPVEKAAGHVYRLPTEAEWEYACRAGTTTRYSFGDDDSELGDYAWFGTLDDKTHPVGTKRPNPWGLYDMHGNVWELCEDWVAKYPSGNATNPTGPSTGNNRVKRGGSWSSFDKTCGSAYRSWQKPLGWGWDRGFRVCLGPSGK